MAATAPVSIQQIPVGEYLGSVYRPDVDYVDGTLEERNAGEFDHADIQKAILLALVPFEKEGYRAIQETRVQVSEIRYRVPDVCVLPQDWKRTQIISQVPLLCVEVLSPRDSIMRMRVRCEDYLRMGVTQVWMFDPQSRAAYVMNAEGMVPATGILTVPGTPISLKVSAIFAVLDQE